MNACQSSNWNYPRQLPLLNLWLKLSRIFLNFSFLFPRQPYGSQILFGCRTPWLSVYWSPPWLFATSTRGFPLALRLSNLQSKVSRRLNSIISWLASHVFSCWSLDQSVTEMFHTSTLQIIKLGFFSWLIVLQNLYLESLKLLHIKTRFNIQGLKLITFVQLIRMPNSF